MRETIERISKDLQELIQKDASTDKEDDEDPMPTTINLDTVELASIRIDSIGTPSFWLRGIPQEDQSSVELLDQFFIKTHSFDEKEKKNKKKEKKKETKK